MYEYFVACLESKRRRVSTTTPNEVVHAAAASSPPLNNATTTATTHPPPPALHAAPFAYFAAMAAQQQQQQHLQQQQQQQQLHSACLYERAAKLLFVVVGWARSMPSFSQLTAPDQTALMGDAWAAIFVVAMAQFWTDDDQGDFLVALFHIFF